MDTRRKETVQSYWLADRAPKPPATPLKSDLRCDVAIIGAGFTGLATGFHLRASDAALDVAILEAETVGFGASSRNAGFVMTLFGASAGLIKVLHGKERVREAHDYMVGAIADLEALIATQGIACDYERSGFLKVATSPAYVSRIKAEMEMFAALGIEGSVWLDRDDVRARVRSPGFLGGCFEPGCGLLNPVKFVEGLHRLALSSGVKIYESTPVKTVERRPVGYRLVTPAGVVTAKKIVYATNGYSHLLPGMRTKQLPAFAYVIATEPLSPEQRASIGWEKREGIEDGLNFMHFYRLTRDGRLIVGGGPGLVPYAGNMENDASPKAWAHLERFIGDTFPVLRGINISHRWGGAFSVTSDSTPQIGTLDGGGAFYSIGCTGHGVAMTHKNGRILAELVLEKKTPLTDLWFVNRRSFPIPPEPLRSLAARSVMGGMALDDWWCS